MDLLVFLTSNMGEIGRTRVEEDVWMNFRRE